VSDGLLMKNELLANHLEQLANCPPISACCGNAKITIHFRGQSGSPYPLPERHWMRQSRAIDPPQVLLLAADNDAKQRDVPAHVCSWSA
jgi:hypothetical protein